MNVVVDTNIFISALIKDSITRKIIVKSNHNFIFPEFEFEEIRKHREEILKKSGLTGKELDILLLRMLNYVKIIPIEVILKYRKNASEIIGMVDRDDVIFVATALAFDAAIWTEDMHFRKQDKIKVIGTNEMVDGLNHQDFKLG